MSDDVTVKLSKCLVAVSALLDAMDGALRDSNPSDVWRYATFAVFARKYNEIVEQTSDIETIAAPVDLFNLKALPTSANSLPLQQQEIFESVRANLHILKAYLTDRVGLRSNRVIETADFLQANLRRAVLRPPGRERDVQDIVEQLFIGRGFEKGTDYDREVGRVKVSAKETIPDFVLAPLKLAIEIKLLRENAALSAVIDEINADINAYKKGYESIVFVVYDLAGIIRDEVEFRRDLEATAGVRVVVVKH